MKKIDYIQAFKDGWLWHDEYYIDEDGQMWYKGEEINLDEIAEQNWKVKQNVQNNSIK